MSKKCFNCGAENPDTNLFCMHCGAKLAQSSINSLSRLAGSASYNNGGCQNNNNQNKMPVKSIDDLLAELNKMNLLKNVFFILSLVAFLLKFKSQPNLLGIFLIVFVFVCTNNVIKLFSVFKDNNFLNHEDILLNYSNHIRLLLLFLLITTPIGLLVMIFGLKQPFHSVFDLTAIVSYTYYVISFLVFSKIYNFLKTNN